MSADHGTAHWPTELRLKSAEKVVEIDFDNGARFRLPAEYLRVESPSAEVQGHGPGHTPGNPLRHRLRQVTHAGGQAAVGQVLRPGAPAACRFEFVVVDTSCNPVENAFVEIWYASPAGTYSQATAFWGSASALG